MYQTSRARRLATRSQPHGALRNSGRARRAPAVYARDYRGHAPAGCGACPPLLSALVVIAARYSHFARATVVQGGPDVDTVSCAQQLARASSAPPAQDPWLRCGRHVCSGHPRVGQLSESLPDSLGISKWCGGYHTRSGTCSPTHAHHHPE
jgi:hypothetical protein